MTHPAVLEVNDLSLSFGGLDVLSGIRFSVDGPELVALIGPNGAGKTSVLNCICGIYTPTRGDIRFKGQSLAGLRPHRIAQLGIARTFQHGELVPHMSVVDNLLVARHARMTSGLLAQGLFSRRVRDEERTHRHAVERIIEFVELERWRHADVAGLPFGLQKVVGFARALAMEPALLLLDEPSSGLNRDERENLARFILRVRIELGVPMIWVEHDMQMVSDLADRLVVLAHGRPLAEGAPGEVLNQPEVVEAYLGRRAPAAG
jgi:branched-chain amino acid transport system ATP-binding protein